MAPTVPPVRVIVRLPYNRPENSLPDPPRVDWNAEKEQILWEVIAKSRTIEGAGTDWVGLATHLQVPLPYLLHRAQTRYEDDLRGLQGIISPSAAAAATATPTNAFPSSTPHEHLSPHAQGHANEYFPRLPEVAARRLSTSPGTSRPLGVRARLSSLGSQRVRRGSMTRNPSQRLAVGTNHIFTPNGSVNGVMSPSSPAGAGTLLPARASKKVSSSSTLTLQGPHKGRRTPSRALSPTSSHADSEGSADGHQNGLAGGSDENDESEEEGLREEEEHRRAEEQQALDKKLRDLERMMTKDALGLVASPVKDKGKLSFSDRRRRQPLSISTASMSSAQASSSRSQQSLSSLSSRSPHGSIPSIPSSPPNTETLLHWRSHPQRRHSLAQGEVLSRSPSSPRHASPIPRHLSPSGQSSSPPAVHPRTALGQMAGDTGKPVTRTGGQGWRMDVGTARTGGRVSEHGSEASSFSDLSDASLSASAMESAILSNSRASRLSSFARSTRSNITGKQRAVRP